MRAPTRLAIVELRPSAPTTSRACRVVCEPFCATCTPATRSRSYTSPVTLLAIRTSAPASAAACTRIGSSNVRRTDTAPPTSPGRWGIEATYCRSSWRTSKWPTSGAPVAWIFSMTPSRSRNASACAWMKCVERVSRGNVACSTTATRTPDRASNAASGDPAQRAPTTITSNCSIGRTNPYACGWMFWFTRKRFPGS